MTFDENIAFPVINHPISFLKLGSMELNLSNKVLNVRIEGFYGAVRWRKVGPNLRFSAHPGGP